MCNVISRSMQVGNGRTRFESRTEPQISCSFFWKQGDRKDLCVHNHLQTLKDSWWPRGQLFLIFQEVNLVVGSGIVRKTDLISEFIIVVQLLSRVQLPTTPWTVARKAPLSLGFPRQEYWIGLPFPPPGDLPDPGMEPTFPALAGGFFTSKPSGKPLISD